MLNFSILTTHLNSTLMNVVILAAGMGKRMQSALPKVLHPLAGKPLLSCHRHRAWPVSGPIMRDLRTWGRSGAGSARQTVRTGLHRTAGTATGHRPRRHAGAAGTRRQRADADPVRRRAADDVRLAAAPGRGGR